MKEFENIINTAWENKDSINGQSDKVYIRCYQPND